MDHRIHRVVGFERVGSYTLDLEFAEGTRQRIHSRSVLEGEVFGPLRDLSVFNAVELDAHLYSAVAERRRLRSRNASRLAQISGRVHRDGQTVGHRLRLVTPRGLTFEWSRRGAGADVARLTRSR